MHAKEYVTSNKVWTHAPYMLGRVADDGQIS